MHTHTYTHIIHTRIHTVGGGSIHMCIYICIHINIRIYTIRAHTHIHTVRGDGIHLYMYVCIHTYIYVSRHIYTYIYIHIYLHIYICIYMYRNIYICIYIHMYIIHEHTNIHIIGGGSIRIYINTHTHVSLLNKERACHHPETP